MSVIKSKHPFTIDGVFYINTVVAAKQLGLSISSIAQRLKNKKYDNYVYV